MTSSTKKQEYALKNHWANRIKKAQYCVKSCSINYPSILNNNYTISVGLVTRCFMLWISWTTWWVSLWNNSMRLEIKWGRNLASRNKKLLWRKIINVGNMILLYLGESILKRRRPASTPNCVILTQSTRRLLNLR